MKGIQSATISLLLFVANTIASRFDLTYHSRSHARDLLQKRENCGPGLGSCGLGLCCSQWNWCGITDQHCGGGCQPEFGACSGDDGGNDGGDDGGDDGGGSGDILNVPRIRFGSVPYGVTISTCSTPGTIAITFDDGPYIFTSQLLDLLAQSGVKSTFFVNGVNYADTRQPPYPDILRRMVADGHQVASHTFLHTDLDTLDAAGQMQEMAKNEEIFRGIFGYFPTYMRPPYGNCQSLCQQTMTALGYHIIDWNIDTLDYAHDDPSGIQTSMSIFDNAVSGDATKHSYISLEHDVHYWTVNSLAAHIINTSKARGYRLVTVGECLGDPVGNWYRDGTTGAAVGGGGGEGGGLTSSTDATCGSNSGGRYTCKGSVFGNCCSQWGWCGSSSEYCEAGCQLGYGTCW